MENLFLKIIFFCTMYPVILLLYFIMREYRKEKNGCLFGVRVKQEWCEREELKRIQQRYQKELKRNFIIFLLLPLVSFLTSHSSIIFSIWMMWLLAAIAGIYLPFIKANKKVLTWKKEQGLQQEKMVQYVEIENERKTGCVKIMPYLLLTVPVAAVTIAACILIPQDFVVYKIMFLGFALLNPLFYLSAIWMDRQQVELISTENDENLRFAREKKKVWNWCWECMTGSNTLWTVVLFCSYFLCTDVFAVWLIAGSIVYGILLLVICGITWKKLGHIEEKYEEKRNLPQLEDDDKNWIFGMFYYNKDDKHIMKSARIGVGTTVNMATPWGMITELLLGICLLALPVCCIWMILLEFTPIQLTVKNDIIIASQLNIDYEIPVRDIISVEEISELPNWSKTSGTAMKNLEKGTFYIRNVGKCQVFLNPENGRFLKVQTKEKTYYLGGGDDEQTEDVQLIVSALVELFQGKG